MDKKFTENLDFINPNDLINEVKKEFKNKTKEGKQTRNRKIAVLDFETTPFKFERFPTPFCCGIYDGINYIHYWDENPQHLLIKVANYLRDLKAIVYAHNGGKFDWHYLYPFFDHDKKIMLVNGRIAKAYLGKAEIRDSFMILPVPLKAHQKDEIPYSLFEPNEREKHKQRILDYLQSDCVNLYNFVQKFIDKFGLKFTLASASFNEIHNTGYNTKIKASVNFDSIFRPFYFGGRCEALKKGANYGEYIYGDINSAYPYAMKFKHPYGHEFHEFIRPKELPPIEDGPYFTTIKAISKGCLPYRERYEHDVFDIDKETGEKTIRHRAGDEKKQGKVTFPRDNEIREYNATSWEIIAGIRTGTLEIKEILRLLIPKETADFSEFIDKFYNERLESKAINDTDNDLLAKLCMNSGYGKFGQDPSEFREYRLVEIGDLPLTEEDYEQGKVLGLTNQELLEGEGWQMENEIETVGLVLWSKPSPTDDYKNVATAASITGFVRAYLWETICNSVEPVYCDTDSVMCKKLNAKISDKLGDWKIEAKTIDGVYIAGKKLYAFPPCTEQRNGYYCYDTIKKAHKGARLNTTQILDIVINKKELEWKNPVPTYSLKRGYHFITRRISMKDN